MIKNHTINDFILIISFNIAEVLLRKEEETRLVVVLPHSDRIYRIYAIKEITFLGGQITADTKIYLRNDFSYDEYTIGGLVTKIFKKEFNLYSLQEI